MNAAPEVDEFGGEAPTPERPIVKWPGGKRRSARRILDQYVAGRPFNAYVEPFCGGAALFLMLRAAYGPFRATLGDACIPLIDCYRSVRSGAALVAERVEELAAQYAAQTPLEREATYIARRAIFNSGAPVDPFARAALFLWINRTCFNGLWRVNKSGAFNVPFGKYAAPGWPTRDHLITFAGLVADASLIAGDYGDAVDARPGTLIYLDPPYDTDEEVIQFTGYAGTFGWEEQTALAGYAEAWTRAGARVIVSNRDTDRIRRLWLGLGWRIDPIEARHNIGATGDRRGNVGELIITKGA